MNLILPWKKKVEIDNFVIQASASNQGDRISNEMKSLKQEKSGSFLPSQDDRSADVKSNHLPNVTCLRLPLIHSFSIA